VNLSCFFQGFCLSNSFNSTTTQQQLEPFEIAADFALATWHDVHTMRSKEYEIAVERYSA